MRTRLLALLLGASMLTGLLAGCGGAEERKTEYLSRGKKYFEEHNYDKAKVELKNALQIDPKLANPYYYLGQIEESKQNWREAFGLYQKASELDPADVDIKIAMAKFSLLVKDLDKASQLIAEILQARPGDVDGRLLKAAVASAKGETDTAIAELESLINDKATRPDVYLVLAMLYGKKNDPSAAERVLQQGIDANAGNTSLMMALAQLNLQLKKPEKAEAVLKQLIASDPGNMDHRAALVTLYVQLQRYDDGEKELRASVQAEPKDVRRYAMLADFLVRSRKADQAVDELRKAVNSYPEEVPLRFALGQLYEQLNRGDAAQAVYLEIVDKIDTKPDILKAKDRLATLAAAKGNTDQAVQLIGEILEESPQDYQAQYLQGRIALAQKDAQKAITTFRSILKDHPDSVEILTLLATAQQLDGKPALAQESLEKAAAVKPEDFGPVKRLIEFLAQQKNFAAALEKTDDYLKLNPKNLDALNAKADLLAFDNKPVEMEKALQQIKADFPDKGVGAFRLGQMYQSQKKYDAAIAEYEVSLTRAENDYEPLKAVTAIYLENKQPEQALARLKKMIAKNPNHPNAYQLLGMYYLSQQQKDDAVKMFKKAIEVNPRWPVPYSNLASVNPNQAVDELQRAVKSYPEEVPFRFALGQLYEQLNQADQAEPVYREIVDKVDAKPDILKAKDRLATLAAAKGKTDEATKLIAEVLEESPQDYQALYLQGRIALSRKDAQKAITTFLSILKDHPDSGEILTLLATAQQLDGKPALVQESLEKAAAVKPNDFGPVQRLIEFLAQQKNFAAALQKVNAYLELNPKNLDAWNVKADLLAFDNKPDELEKVFQQMKADFPDKGVGAFRLAQLYQSQKKYDAAIAEYELSLTRAENDYEPLKAVTAIYLEKKQPEQALARLKKVIAKNPNHPNAYQLLGMYYLSQQQQDDAVKMFKKAIEVNPRWPVPYANLASVCVSKGEIDHAVHTYDNALKLFPDNPDILINLAAIYEKAKDYPSAIKRYEEILAKNPDNLLASNNIASLLSVDANNEANLQRAREFGKHLEKSSEPAFLDTLAWIHYQLKDYDQALPLMQKAMEKSPEVPIFHYHLGMILWKNGDASGAKEHLKKAVDSGQNFDGLAEAKDALAQLN